MTDITHQPPENDSRILAFALSLLLHVGLLAFLLYTYKSTPPKRPETMQTLLVSESELAAMQQAAQNFTAKNPPPILTTIEQTNPNIATTTPNKITTTEPILLPVEPQIELTQPKQPIFTPSDEKPSSEVDEASRKLAEDIQRQEQRREERRKQDELEYQQRLADLKRQKQAQAQAEQQKLDTFKERESQAEADKRARIEAAKKANADALAKQQQAEQNQRKQDVTANATAQMGVAESMDSEFGELQASVTQKQNQINQINNDKAVINEYSAKIASVVYQKWQIPLGGKGRSARVRINLSPTGFVNSVVITQSSGNTELDKSLITAIKAASPLPVPKDTRLFNQKFRQFSFNFTAK